MTDARVNNIVLDTTQVATDTIDYLATVQAPAGRSMTERK
jgi:hypothetical protein